MTSERNINIAPTLARREQRADRVLLAIAILMLSQIGQQEARAVESEHLYSATEAALIDSPQETEQPIAVDANGLIEKGKIELDQQQFRRAIKCFSEALDKQPQSVRALSMRASVYERIGAYSQAIKDYTRAIEIKPDSDLYAHRAWCTQKIGQNRTALIDYDKALELNDKNAIAYKRRGTLRMKLGDYQGALGDFNQVLIIDPEAAKELAVYFKPDLNKAVKQKSTPVSQAAAPTPIKDTSFETGTSEAVSNEDLSNPKKVLARLNNEAAQAISQGKYQKAINLLESLASDYPRYDFARNNLSIAYNNQGLKIAKLDPKGSMEKFRKALYYNPAETATRRNLNSLLKDEGLDPHSYKTRLMLGDKAIAAGDLKGAFVEYSEALRLRNTGELRKKFALLCLQLEKEPAESISKTEPASEDNSQNTATKAAVLPVSNSPEKAKSNTLEDAPVVLRGLPQP